MEKVNLHQQKLYALIVAVLALIAIFLPWTVQKFGGDFFGMGRSITMNGFRSTGFLTFLGIIGVIIASLMGDKTKEYDSNSKMIAMGSFGAIAAGALIYFLLVMGKSKAYGASAGIGVWISIVAGLVGLLWVSGLIKMKPTTPAPPAPPAPPKA